MGITKQQIKQITDESETAIYVADYESDELLFINDTARKILHTKDEEYSGQKCYEFLMHHDTPCYFCHKSLLKEKYFREDIFKFPINGREYKINSKVMIWDGRKVHVHYVSDITELLNHEKNLRAFTDKIPSGVGIYYFYKDGRLEENYLNDGYYKMIGVTRESRREYSGFNDVNAIHPDDLERCLKLIEDGVKNESKIDFEMRVKITDETFRWLRVQISYIEKNQEKSILYASFTDINKLKKTMKKEAENYKIIDKLLLESRTNEQKLKSIMDHVPGATVIFSVKNKLLSLNYISSGCKKITGFTAEETYKRNGEDPLYDVHPDGKKFFEDNEWDDIKSGKNLSYRYRVYCKDGSYKWVSLKLTPVIENEEVLYYGVLADLDTEEKEYLEQENHYNQMIEIMNDFDDENLIAKGRYDLTTNQIAYYGKRGEEALLLPNIISFDEARDLMVNTAANIKFADIIKSELDREKLIREFKSGKTKGVIEYKRVEKNGAYFWSNMKYFLCINPENDDVIFFVYTYDITKQFLEQSMLRMLGNTEYEVMGTINVKTHFFEIQASPIPNKSIENNEDEHNGNYDQVCGERIIKFVPIYEREPLIQQMNLENVCAQLDKNEIFFLTYSIEENGKFHRKKVQYCYLDDSKDTIFFYRSDITSIYNKEQEQIQQTENALEIARLASEAKADFFSRMSHDMRTPMNGILGLAELSLEEDDVGILKESMHKIKESGTYLLGLINDTLDLQKIESGKLELEPRVVYGKTLFQSVIDMVRPSIERKHIDFKIINHNAFFDCFVKTDPVRSRQIFVNLLSNAIKFTPEEGCISIECKSSKENGNIVRDEFIIRDTGVGMSKDFIENKIFQPFSQELNDVSMQYTGTGLGLSIVKNLVEMMGGQIKVESELGSGSTFYVYLDFEIMEDQRVLEEQAETIENKSQIKEKLKGRKVLYAEDHPLNAEITMKLLEKADCEAIWAKNGKECVDIFSNSPAGTFDIILMDIRMPVMDGLTATKLIRQTEKEDSKTIPIIALTANAYDEDMKKSLEVGMNDHLSKPIIPDEMIQKMVHMIK